MFRILLFILILFPSFSNADQGLKISCLNMKSILGKKYEEAVDLGKIFKKGKIKATYAGRKVEINRKGKNAMDWTITFLESGKTVPFADAISNLKIEH